MAGKIVISTDKAPKAAGPYSQGVIAGGLVFTSGMIPIDPATGRMSEGSVEVQARQAVDNLAVVLAESGCALSQVVRVDLLLSDMRDFTAVNRVLSTCFPDNPPARITSQAAALPLGAVLEIAAIAVRG